jgi:dolichol-phosphate mannosyltransferase
VKKVDVVIPVYNNFESLSSIANQISQFNRPELLVRILMVDDGSTDRSWDKIQELSLNENLKVFGIKLPKNFGQLSAMKAGYSLSTADAVVSISADLQDPPILVEKMIHEWKLGSKFVICARKNRDDGWITKITSAIAYKILGVDVAGIPKGGFDTFLMDKQIYESLVQLKGRFNFLQADLLSFGFKPAVIEYTRLTRPYGKSGYNFSKRFRNFINGLIDSSYLFIRSSIRIGIGITIGGMALTTVLLVAKLQNQSPFNGFTLIACSILLIGGFQIVMIGILGSYIWRIYDVIRERPAFVIEKVEGLTEI